MESFRYYIIVCLFPLFFILHGVNENYGLVAKSDLVQLFLKYLLISLGVALFSRLLFKEKAKSFILAFLILSFYFFFGAIKDFMQQVGIGEFTRYSMLIPLILLLILLLIFWLRKTKNTLSHTKRFLSVLLIVIVSFDFGLLIWNIITQKAIKQDFGDQKNDLLTTIDKSKTTQTRPDIYWIVIDEYASSRVLKKIFDFSNPLDSSLRARGFFVADSAQSNYNYTQYSLTSQLDMVYLPEFRNQSVVTPRDAMRGQYSLYRNNVCKFLQQIGYQVKNYSIYDIEGYPTKGMTPFLYTPRSLIDNQTLLGKLSRDLGWQFPILFKKDKQKAKETLNKKYVEDLDRLYKNYHRSIYNAVKDINNNAIPYFLMTHLFDAHEPFIYNEDGTIYAGEGLNASSKKRYIPQLQYSNKVLLNIVDSIKLNNKNKDYIIVLQGDHGFKFEENDPLFDTESCSTLFAVFYKEGNYQSWPNQFSTVNCFRILFNDKYQTRLPLLSDTSFNLLYRSKR